MPWGRKEGVQEERLTPDLRYLLRLQIEDAIGADRVFTMRVADEVAPLLDFIEGGARKAANVDV